MTPETKHHLIVGGGLIVAVVVGIIVYKKYEAQSGASQAAAGQQNQDALAYLEASSLNSPYAYDTSGGGGAGISLPSSPSSTNAAQSIADELAGIEQAFGFGPPASAAPASAAPASTTSASPAPTASRLPATRWPVAPASQQIHALPARAMLSNEPVTLRLDSEGMVA